MVEIDTPPGRWVHGGRTHSAGTHHCRYCGRFQAGDCPPVACLLCGSVQCHGNGFANGTCKVCLYGWLPGWHQPDRTCGYTRCEQDAIANAPRVRRVCRTHADRATVRVSGAGHGPRMKTISQLARDAVAHRDSGAGWQRWRLLNLPPRPTNT